MTPRKRAAAPIQDEAQVPDAALPVKAAPAAQATLRRKMPDLAAYWYDGTNAVAAAQWLAGQGTKAQIEFPTAPNALPYLVGVDGAALPTQVYVLTSLETVDQTDLAANYDVL